MINYILQVILFQVFFLAIYDFFLSKETFFTKNRWYLLITPILSFVIPFIKIPSFQKAVSQDFVIQLPEIILSPEKVIQNTIAPQNLETSINYITVLFWGGVVVFLTLFLLKLLKIINLIRKNEAIKKSHFKLILLPQQTKAFSFFNYIFLGKEIAANQQEKVIAHELVHSKQKHSLDLLLFEFLKIAMWFNPMIYLYQKRITLVHEYISDAVVAKLESKETYINNLLSSFFQVENIAFLNQFYKKSLIKKRIMMITKKQAKKMNQLKYLVLIPVLMSMLFYSSCSENNSDELIVKKQPQTMFFIKKGGEINSKISGEETYLDHFTAWEKPNWKEISINELNEFELDEYNCGNPNNLNKYGEVKLYKRENGRKVVGFLFNSSSLKTDNIVTETEEISFLKIDKDPTFPGCEEGDKKCFSLMIQKHFVKNFDANLPKTLGLDSGKKRVFITFKIDKEGNVIDVKVRAPHQKIQEEVLSVMNTLPKMVTGENDGKVVAVKYSIPFTIIVE